MTSPDDDDEKIIGLWLSQRPRTTARNYRRAWRYFQAATDQIGLRHARLQHLQAYVQSLRRMKPSSQGTLIAAIQSLFSFACKIGYIQTNPGTLIRRPPLLANLAERIVDEADIQRLLVLTTKPRDATLLRLAYVSGLRRAELSGLRWRCFARRDDGAILTVVGKGSRLRHIFLPEYIAASLAALRNSAPASAPIFRSRHGKALSVSRMHAIVKQAAQQAALPPTFSLHWCRHAHASHALDHGAPVHVVQHTLGHASLAATCRYVHCKPGSSSAQYIAKC